MWFIGVEVEPETSAPPPKKNPGSASAICLILASPRDSSSLAKSSLCSPLIRSRMQGKRTDYCKVRNEFLKSFPRENSAQNS